jgi:hypothetical protein
MNKLCVWGIALVAILGLVGLSLGYPSGAPLADDEAAKLVGGQRACFDWIPVTCTVGACNMQPNCWTPGNSNPAGSQAGSDSYCGPNTVDCVPCKRFFRPCMVVTTVTSP